jgi:hypothetical protein
MDAVKKKNNLKVFGMIMYAFTVFVSWKITNVAKIPHKVSDIVYCKLLVCVCTLDFNT